MTKGSLKCFYNIWKLEIDSTMMYLLMLVGDIKYVQDSSQQLRTGVCSYTTFVINLMLAILFSYDMLGNCQVYRRV